jgi:ERF superfamily
MRTSETTNEIAKALSLAQGELKNAAFDSKNPHFGNRYASLSSVRDAVIPSLSKQGIALVQATDCVDGMWTVVTRLIHSSGQWIESVYPFNLDKPQAMGSALSYARRYSLSAITGIASEEDDDGNEGQKGESPKVMPSSNGTQGASKAAVRPDYDGFIKEIRNAASVSALEKWKTESLGAIDKLPPDWVDELRVEFMDRKAELNKEGKL